MFSKSNKVANGNGQSEGMRADVAVKAVPSIISADLTIDGNLSSGGEIQVDGVVNGDIRCKALIVGVKGSVIGEVVAQTVRMHGAVKGMVRAKSVFLASTARMCSDRLACGASSLLASRISLISSRLTGVGARWAGFMAVRPPSSSSTGSSMNMAHFFPLQHRLEIPRKIIAR